ncbi:MAG: excinuclease ABC subunit UvrC [Oscillospiraceae bacterium]|nr:excinuclease ABC subunit UvrC [Oscillospiraceae bacterium]
MNPRLPYLQRKTAVLTTEPGVYIMKNAQEKIIYIGKAKNLRNRVTSYFRDHPDHTPKTAKMVSQVYDYDFIVTASEYEALVLECSLIKQHKPPYNILLKDDKGYHYIRISPPPYSRITAELQTDAEGTYMGPYMSGFTVRQTVNTVNRLFQLPTCNRVFPAQFGKERPCLNYHIGQCMGVCRGKISAEDYADIVADAVRFIKNGGDHTVTALEKRMQDAAERLDFEEAARLRDRIAAIRAAGEKQDIMDAVTADTDVIGMMRSGEATVISVLIYRGGRLYDQNTFKIPPDTLSEDPLEEFLPQYYSTKSGKDLPRTILLEELPAELSLLTDLLTKQAGHAVSVEKPERGARRRLVLKAKQNAAEKLSLQSGRTGRELQALEELGRLLGLEHPPKRIESYDISNLSSSSMVAGMVVFEDGRPLKSAYRRFSIKEQTGQDDYSAMREVIRRRLEEYFKAKEETDEMKKAVNAFAVLPDLILLDGGKTHVAAIQPILDEMGLSVPLFGMVKNDKHRTRAIATDGGEISVREAQAAFHLLTRIQDEVHRFAITYMKSKHKKSSFALTLTEIPGIGEKKAQKLLLTYKTRAQLKAATPGELRKTAGVSEETAGKLWALIQELPDT